MLRGHREGPDRYKGPAALRGVRRLRPRPARVAASAALQLPDEGRFQADGLRPWFGGVGALGLGWRSVQGLSAGARRVGRPLLRRRWARQVPGGPSWRRDGSWGAAGGEPWSPLPLETALLGTDGLSARPGLAGAGHCDCEGPLVRAGGVLALPVSSLISDPGLCGGAPVLPRAQSPGGGARLWPPWQCRPGPRAACWRRVAPSHTAAWEVLLARCFPPSPGASLWSQLSSGLPPRPVSSLCPPGGGDPRVTVLCVSGGGA